MIDLESLRRCFQGIIPALIATCSRDGTPNITYLSQVHFVDDRHVALSCQFFNKTKKNVTENPYASVIVYDPMTFESYELDLAFQRSETAGPLFEDMDTRINAIASQTGMTGVFRLLSADVYEVLDARRLDGSLASEEGEGSAASPPSLRGELRALSLVTERLRSATDLDTLLSTLLVALRDALGFEYLMALVPDEREERLFTVASLGYGDGGIGAEVAIGEGLIGTAAIRRRTLRVSDLDLSYGRAIRQSALAVGSAEVPRPEIPLPGLPDAQSQIAIPLVSRHRLFGVLAVESRSPVAFDEWHAAFLDVVGDVAATAMENVLLRADTPEAVPKRTALPAEAPSTTARSKRTFWFFRNDDCVFVDGDYLIRNVPGRILWKILRSYHEEKRTDFSNRELRLDAALGLPPIKDNLESRLILLRKRLEQKCPELRMVSKSRGQFRLEVGCDVELIEKDSA